jgi:hypothetical protein
MDVDSSAALGGTATTICIVGDDPSMLKALGALALTRWLAGAIVYSSRSVFFSYTLLGAWLGTIGMISE